MNNIKQEDACRYAIEFVSTYLNSRTILDLNMRLEKDLGITGDDAYDLIEEFIKKFNLDASNFDISQYFDGEGLLLDFFSLYKYLTGKKVYTKKKDLTIGHLANAIILGVLE